MFMLLTRTEGRHRKCDFSMQTTLADRNGVRW
jgi:hypothetical protein